MRALLVRSSFRQLVSPLVVCTQLGAIPPPQLGPVHMRVCAGRLDLVPEDLSVCAAPLMPFVGTNVMVAAGQFVVGSLTKIVASSIV